MIDLNGFEIVKPHLRIGRFFKHVKLFIAFDTIVVHSGLLISSEGHEVFEDEDWDLFHPEKVSQIGDFDAEFWNFPGLSVDLINLFQKIFCPM
jgi:hypothetical protein